MKSAISTASLLLLLFAAMFSTQTAQAQQWQLVDGRASVTQGGGYVARISVTYVVTDGQSAKVVTAVDNYSAAAGWREVFTIPANATSIHLQAWTKTGLAWEPWKAIIDKTYPSPPNECIKVYGTTLDPKWNNECR